MGITSCWASASLAALFPSSNKSQLSRTFTPVSPPHITATKSVSSAAWRIEKPSDIFAPQKFDKSHEHLVEGIFDLDDSGGIQANPLDRRPASLIS